jgi:DNA-binding transcriptional MerR regulator
MRISELSEASGTPVSTIKYYLREGLLDRGKATAPNQAAYGEDHLRRLRLIRALVEVGGIGIAEVRAVIEALDKRNIPIHRTIGVAQYALGPLEDADPVPPDVEAARKEVDAFLVRRCWRVHRDAPARRTLADALVTLRRLGQTATTDLFEPYADIVDELSRWELDFIPRNGSRSSILESAIVGTVVFEAVLNALRRMAHEHHSAERFGRR